MSATVLSMEGRTGVLPFPLSRHAVGVEPAGLPTKAETDLAPLVGRFYKDVYGWLQAGGRGALAAAEVALKLMQMLWSIIKRICSRLARAAGASVKVPHELKKEHLAGDEPLKAEIESQAGGVPASVLSQALEQESGALIEDMLQTGPDVAKLADPERALSYLQDFVARLETFRNEQVGLSQQAEQDLRKLTAAAARGLGASPATVAELVQGGGDAGLVDPGGRIEQLRRKVEAHNAQASRAHLRIVSALQGIADNSAAPQNLRDFAASRLAELGLSSANQGSFDISGDGLHAKRLDDGGTIPESRSEVVDENPLNLTGARPSPFEALARRGSSFDDEDDEPEDRPQMRPTE